MLALESLVDELAQRLGLDPVALRRMNLAGPGDTQAVDEPWPVTGTRECLDRLAAHPAWAGRGNRRPGEGTGLAIGIWFGAAAPASATCRVEPDGTITVVTGAVDVSGSSTGLAAIAAETFGVPPEAVTVITADSSSAPFSPPSVGSLITYGVGPAVMGAVAEARELLLRLAAADMEIDPGDLEIVDGVVRPRDAPGRGRTLAEIASGFDTYGSPHPPLEGHSSTAHSAGGPSASGHLARVRVDEETGSVELLEYVVVQDVGRALNPALVEGQMQGGAVQSIGRALAEELVHDATGQLVTGSFLDYAMPRASALPPIETLIVEVPAPEGPFGARGIGESSVLCGPAAIANAIAAATGVRMRELPMTPPRIRAAIRARVDG